MRLSAIKLAGFKSFVDPTVLHIHSNLTGVVGPNGCGKSNIIDAVRWVLGEMSTKQLRGAESEDVIFNGSRDRKPVGRASIEIIFDNSEGRFGDRYRSFGEIAIRRELSRDGTSSYFLNGARCRRRDIVDLFLGTGVAGRDNYAIIQQGTVSRFVEAKPEEIRLILEEAAGISKYKERRRETETRIKHTRENLARLNDLRSELTQRLETLKRQSANAEKFKEFKQQERKLKAELLALRWRGFGAEAAQQAQVFAEAQAELEGRQGQVRAAEAAREQHRVLLQEAGHAVQNRQAAFYTAQAEVARVEQALRHSRELKESRARELAAAEQQISDLQRRMESERQRREGLGGELSSLQQAVAGADAALAAARDSAATADQSLQQTLAGFESFMQASQTPLREAAAEQVRVEQLEGSLAALEDRRQRLESERSVLNDAALRDGLRAAEQLVLGLHSELERGQQEFGSLDQRIAALREQRALVETELHESRQALQTAQGRLASLEALQQAALHEDDEALRDWLRAQGWDSALRLAQQLEVEPGWDKAVEAALGGFLQAICVDDLDARIGAIGSWPRSPVTLVQAGGVSAAGGGLCVDHSLATRVRKGPAAVISLLSTVYAVENESEAAGLRGRLLPGQSLVTRDGLCFGPGWAQHPRGDAQEIGPLGREQAIKALRQQAGELRQRAQALEVRAAEFREQLAALEAQRKERSAGVDEVRKRHVDALSSRQASALRLEQTQARANAVDQELAEVGGQLETQRSALAAARDRLRELQATASQLQAKQQALQDEIRVQRARVADAQRGRDQAAEEAQSLAVQIAGRRSALEATDAALAEMGARLSESGRRRDELGRLLGECDAPLAEQDEARLRVMAGMEQAQQALDESRRRLEEIEADAAKLAQQVHDAEAGVEAVREAAQQARIAHETLSVRRQGLVEQIVETGNSIDELVAGLAEAATVEQWEEQLAAMDRRIQRLGPINLAAIGEYEEQQQREAYLTSQYADLSEALAQLEDAIHKIDRETKSRFKETFDKVDGIFRQTFPKLFGGGEAYLELMGEDLLETGVRVMARPPGKRNSVIQQLSGGEKALTAVALLFALFELNPAPFCLLDEVDAPLDDNNVGRFCDLVREMAERVQFVVITHNKITMEMVHHLHGVTMQEPGVSRLVSVDVDQAVALAEAG